MGTPKTQSRIRQEQVLQAALGIIAEHGLPGLSVARIAERIGLVPSALYRHFHNKDEIIDAVLDAVGGNLRRFVAQAAARTDDPLECLHDIVIQHAHFIRQHIALPRLLFSEDVMGNHGGHRERALAVIENYLRDIEGILRRGQESGRLRPEFPPDTLSRLFLGIIQPAVVIWRLSGGRFDIVNHAEQSWKVFRSLIEPAPAKTS